jgi:hypothetical protein
LVISSLGMVFQVSGHRVLDPGKSERLIKHNDPVDSEIIANQGVIETTGSQRSILIWQDISNYCQTATVPE